jgi:hypothetical protein
MSIINPDLLPHDLDELHALHDSLGEQIDALLDRRADVSAAIWEMEESRWFREYVASVL